MEVIEDNSANDPPKELAEEKQEDKDVDQKVETPDKKDDETELSKELIEEKQEDKDVDKKEDLELGLSENLPSEEKESTTLGKRYPFCIKSDSRVVFASIWKMGLREVEQGILH